MLDEIITELDNFPPLPTNYQRLIVKLNDPDIPFHELEKEIQINQSLSINLLKLANSVYYSGNKTTGSIKDALTRVGLENVKKLAYLEMVHSKINVNLPVYHLSGIDLWKHAIATSFSGQFLAQHYLKHYENDIFIAGLVIDVGKVAINQYLTKNNKKIIANETIRLTLEQERLTLYTDHAEIAGILLSKWNFPSAIIDAVKNHHSPEKASSHPELAALLHIADAIGISATNIDELQQKETKTSVEALKLLNIRFKEIILTIEEVAQKMEEAIKTWLTIV